MPLHSLSMNNEKFLSKSTYFISIVNCGVLCKKFNPQLTKIHTFPHCGCHLLMYCCLLWVINGSGVCKFEGCPLIEMKSRRGSLKYFSDFMVSSYLEISSHLNIKTSSWICYFDPKKERHVFHGQKILLFTCEKVLE